MDIAIVDIDNTICRTNEMIQTKVIDFVDTVYPFPLAQDFFENNPDVFLDAEAALGAAEKLEDFLMAGNRFVYVTAREPWTKTITDYWLKKNDFPKVPVIFTKDKRSVAIRMNATLCIEDAPHELERLLDLMPALVPARKYNESFDRRFDDWTTLDLLKIN